MKARLHNLLRIGALLSVLLLHYKTSAAQGRVVINEYMPWTLNGCGTISEFIELLNFGPGPVNIGCYILTDGDYSITIPPNTILQPGHFYVISGVDSIAYPCANIDSAIHTQLNWNTCNCTSEAIPTTGDGFLTDGGSANEQVVLLDPGLNVIDAVARSLPVESSSLIETSDMGGNCTIQTFDLDNMSITYETIGESAGRGNSFARRLDGDCGWVKDPQQSGNATNNTPGDQSDVSYNFTYINSLACPDDGSVAVTVQANGYDDIFPMNYILAYDADSNAVFDLNDSYTYGTEINPNTITLTNLVPGTYRLTVSSAKGCFLQTFPFTILDCLIALPVRLQYFLAEAISQQGSVKCSWKLLHADDVTFLEIESSRNGFNYTSTSRVQKPPGITTEWVSDLIITALTDLDQFFRLKIQLAGGQYYYSPVQRLSASGKRYLVWPNPVTNELNITCKQGERSKLIYQLFSADGQLRLSGQWANPAGSTLTIPISGLTAGVYSLVLQAPSNSENARAFKILKY